jgi:hypothetical protein
MNQFIGESIIPAERKERRYRIIGEITDFIEEHDIYWFTPIFEYAKENRQDWYDFLCNENRLVLRLYLESRRSKRKWQRKKAKGVTKNGQTSID